MIPAYNEGDSIVPGLKLISNSVSFAKEILVVVDSVEDSTVGPVSSLSREIPEIRVEINTYGPGPSNAIRFGIAASKASTVVVTMADGCDDPAQIDDLARLVKRGVSVACASRYMPGGQQVGGPRFKKFLSRLAGKSFALLTGAGTRDATNSFKAYDKDFLFEVGIESRGGFEVGMELVAKAQRLQLPIAEIPTTWIDRSFGSSNFQMAKWLPAYLKWYVYGLGIMRHRPKLKKLGQTERVMSDESSIDRG